MSTFLRIELIAVVCAPFVAVVAAVAVLTKPKRRRGVGADETTETGR